MKAKFIFDRKALREIQEDAKHSIAEPMTKAMDAVGAEVKRLGRADIAAAGFGPRWQNALRVNRYPKRGVAIDPALWIYHKIPYADVFETGARIAGKPLLWLPLSTTPKKIGNRRMTPELFRKEIGPLRSVNVPGHPPLLVADFSGRQRSGKFSMAGLRKGGLGGMSGRSVPVFVGVSSVTIRKRFHLRQVFALAASKLPAEYARFLRK